ncbi:MAG: prepilin-type N-terminal cleavage/methylation domain-containing protein [Sulfuricellaceae bacterium]|nr:prepilin-type N-terminal cleavage/methylation domain-containing protein [Sulfuricellaceae bacterium]
MIEEKRYFAPLSFMPFRVLRGRAGEGETGFTLIELLIGMALLGFIMTLIFAGLQLGARSWDAAENKASESERMRLAHAFIRKEISQILPMKRKTPPDGNLIFSGSNESVYFLATLPAQSGAGGLYLISIELEQTENSGRLIMKRRTYKTNDQDFSSLQTTEDEERTVLADQIERLGVTYFGAENEQAEAQWHTQWPEGKSLPRLIKLEVAEKNGKAWPELVVAPTIDDLKSAAQGGMLGAMLRARGRNN